MAKDDLVYLGHMLDSARDALSLLEGKGREDFEADRALKIAITHLLQVIGEAAGRVSKDFRDSRPEIPWRQVVGMRHKVVHEYFAVDENVIWQTAVEDLPALIVLLDTILGPQQE